MELITPKNMNILQVGYSGISPFLRAKGQPYPRGITLSSTIDAM